MTRVGISITKQVAFRNSTQEFSNVYYYDGLAGVPSVTDAEALIDQAANREKAWHGTTVTFIRGRLWTQVGSPAQNNMIAQKNLSGTGALTENAQMDKERAFLFRLRAGVDSRGNPVYLRKWYHACANMGGVSITAGILTNASGFTQAQRDTIRDTMNSIGAIGSGTTAGVLCAKGGRLPDTGQVWSCHAFLEHHQLGDMWRAQ